MAGFRRVKLSFVALAASLSFAACAVEHPNVILTEQGAEDIAAQWQSLPYMERAVLDVKAKLDAELQQPINVPWPKDAGGGFTHEQHKRNYQSIQNAGILYQILGDEVYAERARDLLMAYADMYPSLGEHPEKKEQSPGRLFWQSLNEAVWLLYSIQGYDAIKETLNSDEIEHIENDLFRVMVHFLADESPQTFDRIHNHGTWAAAAVGMTGYVLGDQEYVEKALLGLDQSGNSGFLKQMDELFSPDGYYTEGPYYQRYALMPFVFFAKAIDNNEPERNIFEYRDGIVLKAIDVAIQLSYNELFFPINDAIKDKSLNTAELIHAVSIAYGITQDPGLLSLAANQPTISLSDDGLALAQGLAEGLQQPYGFASMRLLDGPQGDQGALDIFRVGEGVEHQALVMKNTSQGLGHGHFDKLNWLFFDNGLEIVSDYGAARFLNIEAKYGGHYLPENDLWAKQTVAHNTLVVDETSHFDGDWELGQTMAPEPLIFDVQEQAQIASASMSGAYDGVDFTRTMLMLEDERWDYPLVVDVLSVDSDEPHQYDLPLHYQGHLVETNFELNSNTSALMPLGEDNGYQYLWVKATANSDAPMAQLTWLEKNRFYTYTMVTTEPHTLLLTQLGANDPNFNLRPESSLIQRVDADAHTFVALLEPHGEYNGTQEYTLNSHSNVTQLVLHEQGDLDLIEFSMVDGSHYQVAISYNSDTSAEHVMEAGGQEYRWSGFYRVFSDNQ